MGKALRPDIQAARDAISNRGTVGIGKAVDNLEGLLVPGETVVGMTVSNEGGPGILVVTDQRVLLSWHHMGTRKQREVLLSQISALSFETRPGGLRVGTLVISSSGGQIPAGDIFGAEGDRIVPLIRQAMANRAIESPRAAVSSPLPPSSSPAPPPPPNVPAGWYPDHTTVGIQRYWDGTGWTEHTAPQ